MSIRRFVSAGNIAVACVLLGACTADPTTFIVGGNRTPVSETPPEGARPSRGFIWSSDAGFKELVHPAGATSLNVVDMNARGQIAGYVTLGEGTENYRAFVWSESDGLNLIGSLVGPDGISMALTIDNAGVIAGISEGPRTIWNGPMGIGLQDGFVWSASAGMMATDSSVNVPSYKTDNRKLPTGTNCYKVTAANERGQSAGYAGVSGYDGCIGKWTLMWKADGNFVEINGCGSRQWCATSILGMNNPGEVVGYNEAGGFRWSESKGFIQMPGEAGIAAAINDNGDVAATMYDAITQSGLPVLWTSTGEIRKIALPPGSRTGYAGGIDAAGRVAGTFY
jgi:hypothetical protein